MRQQLPVNEILAYCKKCADLQKERYKSLEENIKKGAADSSTLTAISMYKHEEIKFRYDIPAVIASLAAAHEVFAPETSKPSKESFKSAGSSKLKAIRLEKGLSQIELAKKAQISLRTLSYYEQESGSINKAQGINLYRLAQILGCSIEELLDIEK